MQTFDLNVRLEMCQSNKIKFSKQNVTFKQNIEIKFTHLFFHLSLQSPPRKAEGREVNLGLLHTLQVVWEICVEQVHTVPA